MEQGNKFKSNKIYVFLFLLFAISTSIYFFTNNKNSHSILIDDFIDNTPMAYLEDLNTRAAVQPDQLSIESKLETDFFKGVKVN